MSRSIRKPYYTEQQRSSISKDKKRIANRVIRHLESDEAPANGKAYRKYSNSWDIRDWTARAPNDKKAYRK